MQDQRSGVAPSVRHKSNRRVDDLRGKALAELARRKAGDAPRRAAKVRLIRKAFILRERGPIDGTASLVPLQRVKECSLGFHERLPLAQGSSAKRFDAALHLTRTMRPAPFVGLPGERSTQRRPASRSEDTVEPGARSAN